MFTIDHGRIRPSKSLADSLGGLLRNRRIHLLDEQKVAYETVLGAIRQAHADAATPKQVIIVRGGPGTGKSVVAVNLLVRSFSSASTPPTSRKTLRLGRLESKLTGILTKSRFSSLFKGSGAFTECDADTFGVLIVDEAHRLNEKSGLYSNLGENQILELIRAARTTVFFLDEDQRIHIKDIGSESEIRAHAMAEGAVVTDLDLPSQFRCNGSDGYLAFVDQFLGIRETAHPSLEDIDYEFHIAESRGVGQLGPGTQSQRHLGPPGRRLLLGLEKQERQPRHGHRIPGVWLCAPMELVRRRRPLDYEA